MILPLRSRPAFWLILPTLILIWFYSATSISNSYLQGYWPSALSNAALLLIFSCALATISAAVEGSRDRSARFSSQAVVRPFWQVTALRLWPSLVCGFLVQLIGTIYLSSAAWGAPGRPPFELLLTYASILFLHSSLGFVLGRAMPLLASLPLSLLLSYGWLGFTWSSSYFPLRFLAGPALASCCSPDTELNPLAIWLPIAFSIPVGLLLLIGLRINFDLRISRRGKRLSLMSSAGTLHPKQLLAPLAIVTTGVLVLVGCLALARDMGPFAYQSRPAMELNCSTTTPSVCLYPQQEVSPNTRPAILSAYQGIEAAGLPIPQRVEAGLNDLDLNDDTQVIVVKVGMTEPQIALSVVSSYLSSIQAPTCSSIDVERWFLGRDVAAAWLSIQASKGQLREDELFPTPNPQAISMLQSLLNLPKPAQTTWYNSAVDQLGRCALPDPPPTSKASP